MQGLETIIRKAGTVLAVIGGVAIIAMMGLIVADVALKYLLNDPIDGTTAVVAAYFMVALVFLPLAHVTLTSGHLYVELFTQKLSERQLRPLFSLNGLLILAYLLFIIVFTLIEAVRRTGEGEAWETAADLMAVWPSRWLLPIGLAAMAAVVAVNLFRHWRDRGDKPEAGGTEPP
ncbi:MAG: TRAP transporter small permease subunit [Rhodospirillales bacterium]|nr:TRAP transporter small permease subunit [Rhodospirillales bacterium]